MQNFCSKSSFDTHIIIYKFYREKFYYIMILAFVLLTFFNPFPSGLLWQTRWHAMILGVLMYKLTTIDTTSRIIQKMIVNNSVVKNIGLLFLSIILGYAMLYTLGKLESISYSLSALVLCNALFVSMYDGRLTDNFIAKAVIKLGDISYSWYLSHIPVFFLFKFCKY